MQSKAPAQPAAQRPATVEEKLSRPLEASVPRPAFPRPIADDNLMVQLESPTAARTAVPAHRPSQVPARLSQGLQQQQRPMAAAGSGYGRGDGMSGAGGGGRGGFAAPVSFARSGGGAGGDTRDWQEGRPGWGGEAQPAHDARRNGQGLPNWGESQHMRCAASVNVRFQDLQHCCSLHRTARAQSLL